MSEQHYAAAVCAAVNSNQRPPVLPYCDQCEDDHPSRIAADGTIVCMHEDGGDR